MQRRGAIGGALGRGIGNRLGGSVDNVQGAASKKPDGAVPAVRCRIPDDHIGAYIQWPIWQELPNLSRCPRPPASHNKINVWAALRASVEAIKGFWCARWRG